MTPAKLFNAEEVNALVPRFALRLRDEMESLARTTHRDPAALTTEDLLRQRPSARRLVEELDVVVHEIEETGAELKDVQLGLVDFPARLDGEIVHLCWQFGEPEVAFWHRLDEGFAGRRPLPGSARPPSLQ